MLAVRQRGRHGCRDVLGVRGCDSTAAEAAGLGSRAALPLSQERVLGPGAFIGVAAAVVAVVPLAAALRRGRPGRTA